MIRFENKFIQKLLDFDFETIENEVDSVYAIDCNYRLVYFNKAYLEFSKSNNGEPYITQKFPLGSYLPDAIYGVYKNKYLKKIDLVLATGKSEVLFYECSSDKYYRQFMQKIYPLRNKYGVLILNSLNVEKKIEIETIKPSTNYIQQTGFINQCSNCRRTQSAINLGKWDWVSDYVANMPKNVSHTICPICFDYYWKNG